MSRVSPSPPHVGIVILICIGICIVIMFDDLRVKSLYFNRNVDIAPRRVKWMVISRTFKLVIKRHTIQLVIARRVSGDRLGIPEFVVEKNDLLNTKCQKQELVSLRELLSPSMCLRNMYICAGEC